MCTTSMSYRGCYVHGLNNVTEDNVPLSYCIDTVNENEVESDEMLSPPSYQPLCSTAKMSFNKRRSIGFNTDIETINRDDSTRIYTSLKKKKPLKFSVDSKYVTIRRRQKDVNIAAPRNFQMLTPIVERRRRPRPTSSHTVVAPNSNWRTTDGLPQPKVKRKSFNIIDPGESDLDDFKL